MSHDAQEGLILEVTAEIYRVMERESMNQDELAALLGVGKSHVSQLLNGGRNMTMRTLSDIAERLGCKVQIKLVRGVQ